MYQKAAGAPARARPRCLKGEGAGTAADVWPVWLDPFANTADGAVAVDLTGRIIFWNHAAEAILGYTAPEVVGRRCHEVLHGRDADRNLICHPHCHVLAMAHEGEPAHAHDVIVRAKDGAERWLNMSTVLMSAPDKHLRIVVRLFRDVTETRRPLHLIQALLQRGLHDGPDVRLSQPPGWPWPLTAREREVLELLARGEGTRAIARRLSISTATVRNHTQSILVKLGVHSRLEAVALAFRSRLV
jgi:PAS domain S-box-containing protein